MRKYFGACLCSLFSVSVLASLLVFGLVAKQPLERLRDFAFPPVIVTITNDGGGLVGDYDKFVEYLQASHVKVHVAGACVSACTLLLSLSPEQICVGPNAKFGFHLAVDARTGIPDIEATDMIIQIYYPPAIQKWIDKHRPLTQKPVFITAKEIVDLGVLSLCSE
jgi:hypothetical protein